MHLKDPHAVITLNPSQVLTVEREREVELTEAQVAPLRRTFPKAPRRWTVLTSRWEDCTCGFDFYAVWFRPGEIEIPRYLLEGAREAEEESLKRRREWEKAMGDRPAPKLEEWLEEEPPVEEEGANSLGLILDPEGKVFLDGKEVSEDRIGQLIASPGGRQTGATRGERWVSVDAPPPLGGEKDKRIRASLKRILLLCKERGARFYAAGFPEEALAR